MSVFIFVLGTLFFLSLGYVVGGMAESRHFQSLEERESLLAPIMVSQLRGYPAAINGTRPPQLLVSEVVISSDYLKSFLAGLRGIFGGEIKSFRTLMERARREALVRIKEEAQSLGYNAVCNIRLETADVAGRGSQQQKQKIIMASIVASATAYHASDERHG